MQSPGTGEDAVGSECGFLYQRTATCEANQDSSRQQQLTLPSCHVLGQSEQTEHTQTEMEGTNIWSMFIVIERFEGKRFQHFGSCEATEAHLETGHCVFHVKQPTCTEVQSIYKSSVGLTGTSQDAVIESCVTSDSIVSPSTGVEYVFMFGQRGNSSHLLGDKHVVVRLCDPRFLVRVIRVHGWRDGVHERQDVEMNNLCGKAFLAYPVDLNGLGKVCTQKPSNFGCVAEIYSVLSHMSLKPDMQTVMIRGAGNLAHAVLDVRLLSQMEAEVPIYAHLLVLSGCLGRVVDISAGGFIEMLLDNRFRNIFRVIPRHEELMSHVDLYGEFSEDVADFMQEFLDFPEAENPIPRIRGLLLSKFMTSVTITRFSEVTFRVWFTDPLLYTPLQDWAIHATCSLYLRFLDILFSGSCGRSV